MNRAYERKLHSALVGKDLRVLAIGFIRYEAVRKMSPRVFTELCRRNLEGLAFDDLIDALTAEDKP
jgi:hypothetical protein